MLNVNEKKRRHHVHVVAPCWQQMGFANQLALKALPLAAIPDNCTYYRGPFFAREHHRDIKGPLNLDI
jgi:hypothetical protein